MPRSEIPHCGVFVWHVASRAPWGRLEGRVDTDPLVIDPLGEISTPSPQTTCGVCQGVCGASGVEDCASS
jgi:hypothetical protein